MCRCGLELVSWRASNLFPNLLLNVCGVCLCTKDVAAAILFLLRLFLYFSFFFKTWVGMV